MSVLSLSPRAEVVVQTCDEGHCSLIVTLDGKDQVYLCLESTAARMLAKHILQWQRKNEKARKS